MKRFDLFNIKNVVSSRSRGKSRFFDPKHSDISTILKEGVAFAITKWQFIALIQNHVLKLCFRTLNGIQ